MVNISRPKYSNIARPYALAAFEYARDHEQLSAWKLFLESAFMVARDPSVEKLLDNPEIVTSRTFDLFSEVLATQLNSEQKNFLLILAQNKRLMILPEIAELFTSYLAAFEKMSTVRVVTAVEIDDEYKQKLAKALTKRIQHQVTLMCEINPDILGGAIIQIGDRVIDGSIRGKLNRLFQDLTG